MKSTGSFLLLITAVTSSVLFLGSIHTIAAPFILAAFLAYMVNPLIRVFTRKFHCSRLFAITVVFLVVASILTVIAARFTILLSEELKDLSSELHALTLINGKLSGMPDWLQVLFSDTVNTLRTGSILSPNRIWPYLFGALSGVGSVFVFFVTTFYFLKDGQQLQKTIIRILPARFDDPKFGLLAKVTVVLNNYLRGQVVLILLMSVASWIVLAIFHVKYALILGIFTGIAEIVPIIGPIAAGTVAALVAVFDGNAMLALPPFVQGVTIALVYFIFRQIEDVFVIPHVMGKATSLHPLIVLFAVLVGGHFGGVLGMVFAVPAIALFKLFFTEFLKDDRPAATRGG
jgi:predicted PurR-regulated permease PerM